MASSYPRAYRRPLCIRILSYTVIAPEEDGATLYTVQWKTRWWSPWIEYGTTHTLDRAMEMLTEVATAYAREER